MPNLQKNELEDPLPIFTLSRIATGAAKHKKDYQRLYQLPRVQTSVIVVKVMS